MNREIGRLRWRETSPSCDFPACRKKARSQAAISSGSARYCHNLAICGSGADCSAPRTRSSFSFHDAAPRKSGAIPLSKSEATLWR